MLQADSQSPSIFICYRRDDTGGHAGRLYDHLAAHFGKDQVFMDVDYIRPGEDFVKVIENAVGSCEALLALIGRSWLTIRGESGRRLDNPNDLVHLEIAAALARGVRVIPVLVQGAQMPSAQELPKDLSPLSRRNAVELSDLRWNRDVEQLIGTLNKTHPRGLEGRDPEEPPRRAAAAQSPPQPERRPRPKRRRVALLALFAAVALAVVVASAAWMLSRLDPRAAKAKAETLTMQGVDFYTKDDYDETIRVTTEALSLDPQSSFAYSIRGAAYLQKGAYGQTIKDCTQAIGLDPKREFAYTTRAIAYQKTGDYDRAMKDCADAITINPKSAFAYSTRGNSHFYKGDYDGAVKDYTMAVTLDPKLQMAYENRARAYEKLDREDLAAADRQQAEALKRGK